MKTILKDVENYYTGKIKEYGPSPRGVDWKDEESQVLRFEQLLRIIDSEDQFSLNDLGCGYGKLYDVMNQKNYPAFNYKGYDLSAEMIDHASCLRGVDGKATFQTISDPRQMQTADYTVGSGLFNVRLEHEDDEWDSYVKEILGHMNHFSRRGFAFNCLTVYSDPDRMKSSLYYADPCYYFDYCKRYFARNVALLHDYALYEFTLLVRKG